MHIHELLPYTGQNYLHPEAPLAYTAIGWLDAPYSYTRGPVPVAFFNKISEWCADPDKYGFNFHRGFHLPTIEKYEDSVSWYEDNKFKKLPEYPMGNGSLNIRHKGKYFVTPMMIYQYIHEFGYCPPQEFIEAVVEGELIDREKLEICFHEAHQKSLGQSKADAPDKNFRAERHMKQCEHYLSNGNNEAAERELKAALKLKPNDTKSLFYQARISFDKKELKVAEKSINLALSQAPQLEVTRAMRGLILFELGKTQEAEEDLLYVVPKLREKSGNNLTQILFYLGKIASKKHKYKQAKTYYQEALDSDPADKEIKRKLTLTKPLAFISSITWEKKK